MALSPPQVIPTILIVQQTTTPIPTPPITTDSPTITTVVPEPDALSIVQLRVKNLEKDVSELKKINHSTEALATLKSQAPTVVEHYLGSKIDDDLQKHALMEALIEDENSMDKGVADTTNNHKRQHHDDDDDDNNNDPSAGPNQGKKTNRRRTKESESSKKPSTTKETSKVMDDLETNSNKDVVNDADRPQEDVAPKTDKPSRDAWFKQPLRPPTPDPEWNKRQVVTD
ncbi:hypothetical protein Tco_0582773 [Tanacetum coccineum]